MGKLITTDYTNNVDTFQSGMLQQSRLAKFLRDKINQWISQPNNIQDKRLRLLFFDQQGNKRNFTVKVGTPFSTNTKFAGTTPSIIVAAGQIQYDSRPVHTPNVAPVNSPMNFSRLQFNRLKIMHPSVSIVTQSYDQTQVLAQFLSMILLTNSLSIVKQCRMLSQFDVLKVDAPTVVGAQQQTKQVYGAAIQTVAAGYIHWTFDTQGPVFRGLTTKVEQ